MRIIFRTITFLTGILCLSATNAQTISGIAKTETNVGIADATVTLTGPGFSASGLTNSNGEFSFTGMPDNQTYELCIELNTNPLNGISTYDVFLLTQHLLDITPFNSPYKIIAGETGPLTNEVPNFLDVYILKTLILGIISDFPPGINSWKFIPADFVFPNPANPFASPFPQGCKTIILSGNALNQDFIGVKTGDFNNNAVPN